MGLPTEFLEGVALFLPRIERGLHGVTEETRDLETVEWLSTLRTRCTTGRHPTRSPLTGAHPSKDRRSLCCYPNNV